MAKVTKFKQMHTGKGFAKFRAPFEWWLAERGAQLLTGTNPYEVFRFSADKGTGVIYSNLSNDSLNFQGIAEEALLAFCGNTEWRATRATQRPKRSLSPHMKTIIARDGRRCFFCGEEVSDEDASIDHLVELTAKGPNHISNFALMHRRCNMLVSGWPAMKKIRAYAEWRIMDALLIGDGFRTVHAKYPPKGLTHNAQA